MGPVLLKTSWRKAANWNKAWKKNACGSVCLRMKHMCTQMERGRVVGNTLVTVQCVLMLYFARYNDSIGGTE